MNVTYFDTVDQIFVSDENFHVITGVSTGETTPQGVDIIEKNTHLVIPYQKAVKIFTEIANHMAPAYDEMLNRAKLESAVNTRDEPIDTTEMIGSPIIIKFE